MCFACSNRNPLDYTSSVDHDPIGEASASKPVFSVDGIVQQLRAGWGATLSWRGDQPIQYAIPSAPFSGTGEGAGFVQMTALMQARAELAFELWDDLVAADMVRTTTTGPGHIQFGYSSQTGNSTYARVWGWDRGTGDYGLPRWELSRSEIWLATSWSSHNSDGAMFLGGYGFMTYLHEIGHALGLSHPGAYNGTGSYASDAAYLQDTHRYTVMSYFNANADGSGTDHSGGMGWRYASTPMLHDIAAIQAIYGADMSTRSGDTVYGFNNTSGRAVFDFAANSRPVVAIWDGGGNDTIDLSGYSMGQRIDLASGGYSDVGGLTNNLAIAIGAVIENARGGTQGDIMRGNEVGNRLEGNGGNDWIEGYGGSDRLFGGDGDDTIIGGDGDDEIHGGGGRDLLLGGAEGDVLLGDEGDDLIGGGHGWDLIRAGSGNDGIDGGQGNDWIFGGDGDDTLDGDIGADMLWGEGGRDTFRFGVRDGQADTIFDFEIGLDRIVIATGRAVADVIASAFLTDGGSTILDLGDNSYVSVLGRVGLDESWFA